MIVSYNWLQKYFKDALPDTQKVADAFTFGAFEIEGVEKVQEDTAFDLKVLPDRACYALSHRGVAYELSAILGQKSNAGFVGGDIAREPINCDKKVSVTVEDTKLCPRYCARYVAGVEVGASPDWLRLDLENVGQRSINTIVDATNYVMLDMGQPLHAFDADKVQGGIVVRLAKAGETIELLPEKNSPNTSRIINLDVNDLVIADDAGPIAIAGVKGGLRASVTNATKNIILESANFNAVSVRKTSTRLVLRNDASKRFENNLSVEFAGFAIEEVTALIKKLCANAKVGEVKDVFVGAPAQTKITVNPDFIFARLGVAIPADKLEEIFSSLHFVFEKTGSEYVLIIPLARLDLNMPEDIVEEVGRIYGYDKIAPAIPQKVSTPIPVNQFAYWTEKIKDVLFDLGFSEVQTYSLVDNGYIEIQNPLASDKGFLRKSLMPGLTKALEQNSRNSALLGLDEVKIFEVGSVFNAGDEYLSLGITACITKNIKKKDQATAELISQAFKAISDAIGINLEAGVEINLTKIIPSIKPADNWDIKKLSDAVKYVPFSQYPFMVRDVAVFVPSTVSEKEVSDVIDSNAGVLKVRRDLFDVFTKKFENGEEKTSYAFHIVFQSHERTLVEEEVNAVMQNITQALTAKNWQVR